MGRDCLPGFIKKIVFLRSSYLSRPMAMPVAFFQSFWDFDLNRLSGSCLTVLWCFIQKLVILKLEYRDKVCNFSQENGNLGNAVGLGSLSAHVNGYAL